MNDSCTSFVSNLLLWCQAVREQIEQVLQERLDCVAHLRSRLGLDTGADPDTGSRLGFGFGLDSAAHPRTKVELASKDSCSKPNAGQNSAPAKRPGQGAKKRQVVA